MARARRPLSDIERVIVLLVVAALVAVTAQRLRLPITVALLLTGLALGAADIVTAPTLNAELILLIFLPALLFEAAFVLDLRLLWSVRTGVLVLALPGVLLAMVIGGALTHWGAGFPWTVALLFGAMLAATDPVAVLATFRQLGVDPRLSALIEGESLLNDGVALVLLVTLVDTVHAPFRPAAAVGAFALAVLGGTLLGCVVGWIGHRLIALADQHLTEMTVSIAVAYGAFLAAEELHMSGVLATISAAMVLGHLGRKRGWVFTGGSEQLLTDLWAFLAYMGNAGLFLLMGFAVRASGLVAHPVDVLWGVGVALLGRAVVAYGLGPLLGRLGTPVSRGERHVLFWGGLRGAVALAAALSLPLDFPHRAQLLAMTYGAVLFTLVAQGLTIEPLVRRLGLLRVTTQLQSTAGHDPVTGSGVSRSK